MPDDNTAAWNTAAQLGTTAANVYSQSNTNKKERKFAEDMMYMQRQWAEADWDKTNAYNHPSAQMARLREAGLNPNLIYGKGAGDMTSAPIRSVESAKWNPKAPDFSGVTDIVSRSAQVDNLRAQNTLLHEQALLTKANRINIEDYRNPGQEIQNRTAGQYLHILESTLQEQIDFLKGKVDKQKADTQFTVDQNERNAIKNSQDLKESIERVASIRANREQMLPAQVAEINARIESLKVRTQIDELERQLNEKGLQKTDPLWQRMAARIAQKAIEANKKFTRYKK